MQTWPLFVSYDDDVCDCDVCDNGEICADLSLQLPGEASPGDPAAREAVQRVPSALRQVSVPLPTVRARGAAPRLRSVSQPRLTASSAQLTAPMMWSLPCGCVIAG